MVGWEAVRSGFGLMTSSLMEYGSIGRPNEGGCIDCAVTVDSFIMTSMLGSLMALISSPRTTGGGPRYAWADALFDLNLLGPGRLLAINDRTCQQGSSSQMVEEREEEREGAREDRMQKVKTVT